MAGLSGCVGVADGALSEMGGVGWEWFGNLADIGVEEDCEAGGRASASWVLVSGSSS